MRQNSMKLFWTVWQIDGASNHMLVFLVVKNHFYKYVNMFDSVEISETIHEGVIESSYQNNSR